MDETLMFERDTPTQCETFRKVDGRMAIRVWKRKKEDTVFEVSIAKASAESVVLEDVAPKMGRPSLGRDHKVSAMLDDESLGILKAVADHLGLRPGRVAGEILIPLLKGLDLDSVIAQIEDLKAQTTPIVPQEAYKMAS